MKRNYTSVFVLAAASLLYAGCDGTLQRKATKNDVTTFAAALKDGKSPAEACKELGEVCNTTGQGCNAFEFFCGEVYGEACNKLQEVCQLIPEACDLHKQHCDGDDDPEEPKQECCDIAGKCVASMDENVCVRAIEVCSDEYGFEAKLPEGDDLHRMMELYKQVCEPNEPPPPPKDECCDIAGQCVASRDHNVCMTAMKVCGGEYGFEEKLPEGDDLHKMLELYKQVCEPGEPPKPPVEERCCELAMNCLAAGQEEQCEVALKVCSNEFGHELPQELPPGMDWEQLEMLVKQVCEDPGVNPEPVVSDECCKLAMPCLQDPEQDFCQEAVKVCADHLNIPAEQIPPDELEKYIPIIEGMCKQQGF